MAEAEAVAASQPVGHRGDDDGNDDDDDDDDHWGYILGGVFLCDSIAISLVVAMSFERSRPATLLLKF